LVKLHSFANFGVWVGVCDLQMCAMYVGYPNCTKGRRARAKTNFFLCTNIQSM